MEGGGGAVPEAVYIKQEPAETENEEQNVRLLTEQIKVEIEFKRESTCVKQEPPSEDEESGSESAGRDDNQVAGPERVKSEDLSQVAVEASAGGSPAPRACSAGDVPTGSQTDTQRNSETNPYTCEICGKKFKEIYFYLPHMQLHEHNMEIVEQCVSKQTKLSCNNCDKVYTSKSGLYQHQQKHYCARYSCKYCDKQFTMMCYLKKHERIHTKPYSCDICKKSFAESTALMTHKRIHTGEKPYSCEQCEKKFAHLSDLAKHKRIHTGEKPYSCEVCKKQFRCASHLATHRRVHSDDKPHSCDTCKKQFSDLASLNVHKRIHTGERPYSCEICKKQFTRNSSLITHRLSHTHSGYKCEECEKKFTQLGNLRKHYRAQHPEMTSP